MVPEMQVKQYVAKVRGAFGSVWYVYRTGSDRHYLFSCAQNPVLSFLVLKTDLQPLVRRMLAQGRGNAL